MKRNVLNVTLLIVCAITGSALGVAAQQPNDREVRDAARSLSTRLDNFEYEIRYQLQTTSVGSGQVGTAMDLVRRLRDAQRNFQQNLDRRRENRSDVNDLVSAALRIEEFVRSNQVNRRVEDDWNAVKRQIERIAQNYGVTPDWNEIDESQPAIDYPDSNGPGAFTIGLSGTYELDIQRSESIDDIVSSSGARAGDRDDLREKLTAPGQIAIDIRGTQITLTTSNANPVTFAADGRDKVEQGPNGRTIRLRATLSGDTLTISSLGGESDYTIVFTSVSDGRVLKVTRRITTDYLRQTVFAESIYNKTDSVARLGINSGGQTGGYSDNDGSGGSGNYGGAPTIGQGRTGEFVVPDGVTLSGILENDIDTKVSQNNDRFRMTVQSPYEFRGAVVEGYISGVGRSGRVSGRSNITFNFDRITLRDGKSYDFAGYIQSIKDQNGKAVKVDTEGTAKGDSQTGETAKRGGAGAGIGAVIGAIAGGAKGAVIGAIIGGSAGAGTVAIQGRDDIKLMRGSVITIRSSSPIRSTPR